MDLKPHEIIASLDKLPPYQRDEAAANYNGLPINWKVNFNTVLGKGTETEKLRLMLRAYENSYPWIYAEISIIDYPEIKVLHKGDELNIVGKIKSVGLNDIEIEDVKLTILPKKQTVQTTEKFLHTITPTIHSTVPTKVGESINWNKWGVIVSVVAILVAILLAFL